jgi:hypothetical protein
MINQHAFPTSNDWAALQGGKPRIFESETGLSFQIVHIYGDEFDRAEAAKVPQYGCVIPTIGDNFRNSLTHPVEKNFKNTLLEKPVERSIRVPAALLIEHHGKACAARTYNSGSRTEGYAKVRDAEAFEGYIKGLRGRGFVERRLAIDPNSDGFRLLPMVMVAPVR